MSSGSKLSIPNRNLWQKCFSLVDTFHDFYYINDADAKVPEYKKYMEEVVTGFDPQFRDFLPINEATMCEKVFPKLIQHPIQTISTQSESGALEFTNPEDLEQIIDLAKGHPSVEIHIGERARFKNSHTKVVGLFLQKLFCQR